MSLYTNRSQYYLLDVRWLLEIDQTNRWREPRVSLLYISVNHGKTRNTLGESLVLRACSASRCGLTGCHDFVRGNPRFVTSLSERSRLGGNVTWLRACLPTTFLRTSSGEGPALKMGCVSHETAGAACLRLMVKQPAFGARAVLHATDALHILSVNRPQ